MANDRIYQLPTEVLVAPSDHKARIYQEPVEVLHAPASQKAQIYQLAVEVLYPSSNPTTPTATPHAWGYILGG